MTARTDREILLKQLVDKEVALSGDVTLDDTNIATIAAQTTSTAASVSDMESYLADIDTNTGRTETDTLELLKKTFGKSGATWTTGAIEVEAGTYYAVQFINETVVGTFEAADCDGTMSGTYPAACIIYADVTNFVVSSGGPAVLYKIASD